MGGGGGGHRVARRICWLTECWFEGERERRGSSSVGLVVFSGEDGGWEVWGGE